MSEFGEKLKRIKFEFYDHVIRDILVSLDNSLFIPAMILSFRCIEYLGFDPDRNQEFHNTSFKRFLSEHASCVNILYRKPKIQNFLSSAKCYLLNPYFNSEGISEQPAIPRYETYPFASHLCESKDYGEPEEITISVFEFIADVIAGLEKYFREINDNFQILDWYERLFVRTGISEGLNNFRNGKYKKDLYLKLHPSLKCIDDLELDFLSIKRQVLDSLLKGHGYVQFNLRK
ncbi:hypothetical protein LEP1GSC058_1642 [Leptospira fainei serovar Hurstbridge str. BUT 6]|uniref:Uncharacterized protein n=1 Tax=Leptospira fainei serovar Hurstbridge str. BUT 6 TaxID=1193011 RepID=S3W3N6_9LEPT|nr:hypothetical protein [Leptospira fainei]EPG74907.1 hypothetical protein LEP1GSC058_1642 [Leptospira fainei serovar Hurstbridge str. BUT 6]